MVIYLKILYFLLYLAFENVAPQLLLFVSLQMIYFTAWTRAGLKKSFTRTMIAWTKRYYFLL